MLKRENKRDTIKKLAIGSTIAAVAGYVAGILTAPKSGKETRSDIKQTANQGIANAEKELKKLHTDLDELIKDAKANGGKLGKRAQAELNELVEKAKDSKEKVREVLSAIHEGDADDKDLQKAIKQASQALKNLKKYLKK